MLIKSLATAVAATVLIQSIMTLSLSNPLRRQT